MATRVDGQITGLAGEFFVAAELLKRGLQASLTFGNAKSIDLFAFNPRTSKTFTVQVKALRKSNYFVIDHAKVQREHTYVFVLLNEPNKPVNYFVVPGEILVDEPSRFGRYFQGETFPGVNPRILREEGFEDAWSVFE